MRILKCYFQAFYHSLDMILDGFQWDSEFIEDMVKRVKASMELNPVLPFEALVSYGNGRVKYEIAEKLLGESSKKRLLHQGHVEEFFDKGNNSYLMPKVPELLAPVAVKAFVREYNEKREFENFLNHCQRLPYGDLVAANIFAKLSKDGSFSLFELINRLINEPPKIVEVSGDFELAM